MKRISMLSGLTISVPNAAQGNGGQPLNVVMTTTQVLVDDAGKQVGFPVQQQQLVIASDLSAEVLASLNAQLAYTGFELAPVAATATTE
jgi:hypothetical protein